MVDWNYIDIPEPDGASPLQNNSHATGASRSSASQARAEIAKHVTPPALSLPTHTYTCNRFGDAQRS